MPDQKYNPVKSVNGATVPVPSKYNWTVNDVSSPDAGRTEDGIMHKKREGRKRKLELEWQNVSMADANAVLRAFEPEYMDVNCLDPLANGYVTKRFYSGDQGASAYNIRIDKWTVSFNIIEQ